MTKLFWTVEYKRLDHPEWGTLKIGVVCNSAELAREHIESGYGKENVEIINIK